MVSMVWAYQEVQRNLRSETIPKIRKVLIINFILLLFSLSSLSFLLVNHCVFKFDFGLFSSL